MRIANCVIRSMLKSAVIGHSKPKRHLQLEALESRHLLATDFLYIGDAGTDSVQKFDASSGAFVGSFIAPGSTEIRGPRGVVFFNGNLLVVNQNSNTPFNGEVLRFNGQTGAPLTPLVSASNTNAPFAPRGLVIRNNVAYVADFEGSTHPRIAKYNATSGAYLGELVATGFSGDFRPRGLVFGPDGGLYASVFSTALFGSSDPTGYILRFDTSTGGFRVVAKNNGDGVAETGEVDLHNPEGLVFGPDGRIYVTSNRTNATSGIDENTSIVVIDPATGLQFSRITLTPNSRPDNPTRQFAQAILFGPSGKLYIPYKELSLNDGLSAGGVLTYDPASGQRTALVIPSLFDPPLHAPFYLTFGQTDPATLGYVASPTALPPVLSNLEASPLLIEGGVNFSTPQDTSSALLSTTISVSDPDSASLAGATISIIANYKNGGDRLLFTNTAKITGTWNQTSGVLTLSGTDTVANYQAALRSIRFQYSGFGNPIAGKHSVRIQVSDGVQQSNQVTREVRVAVLRGDYLFIGDQGVENDSADDVVRQFDVTTQPGSLVSTFVAPNQLIGPRGMVFDRGKLLVVNQNTDTPFNGEVLAFDGKTGVASGPLVNRTSSQAPFAPRGTVIKDGVLYVADFEGNTTPRIAKYNSTTGAFLGNLVPNGFTAEFRPRGLVFGPDGKLYVSVFGESSFATGDPAGYVLRFPNPSSNTFEVVAANNGDGIRQTGEFSDLHNPEGIVFGPDGRLYVTSFRVGASDNRILGIDVTTKTQRSAINLGSLSTQAILFGPGDGLYVPLSDGSVRVYNVSTNAYQTIVPPAGSGGPLQSPWYLTFTQTNPATLAYQPWHNFANRADTNGLSGVTPLDALIVINEVARRLNQKLDGRLSNSRAASNYFFDVTGDSMVSPLDALAVINVLPRTTTSTSSAEQVSVSGISNVELNTTLLPPSTQTASSIAARISTWEFQGTLPDATEASPNRVTVSDPVSPTVLPTITPVVETSGDQTEWDSQLETLDAVLSDWGDWDFIR